MKKHLDLYSKPRGAGDHTSGGRNKLLNATSNITKAELLIRETVQNSWDAALTHEWNPSFLIDVYKPTIEAQDTLCDQVFYDVDPSMDVLDDRLTSSDTYVMEISDRGTIGLNGPVRASRVPRDRANANFNSLVFDIGSTKESATSGGTYGFGKTVAFDFSGVHTLVYWTATVNESGQREYRFIASALHDEFSRNDRRYTGAHWWGQIIENSIEPVIGDSAQQLGESIFNFHFNDEQEETGTSVLIVDPTVDRTEHVADGDIHSRSPVRTYEDASLLVEQLKHAIGKNAWPKFVPYNGGTDDVPLDIRLALDGEQIDLKEFVNSQYAVRSYGLQRIRAIQANEQCTATKPMNMMKDEDPIPIQLRPPKSLLATREEIFGGRTDNVVGHLYVCEYAEVGPREAQSNHICFMRSEAELPAWYETVHDDQDSLIKWVAIFKPTPECDPHFAASEPPSHDAWTPNIADSAASKYVVERTLINVRSKLRQYLATLDPKRSKSGTMSTRQVARNLSRFAPRNHNSIDKDERHTPPRRGTRRRKLAKPIDLIEVRTNETQVSQSFDSTTQRVELRLPPDASESVRLNVNVGAVTPEGTESTSYPTRIAWSNPQGVALQPPVRINPGDSVRVEITSEGIALLELSFAEE